MFVIEAKIINLIAGKQIKNNQTQYSPRNNDPAINNISAANKLNL